jgi:hypothetical protein
MDKGQKVKVKAKTWSDYYDNHVKTYGKSKGKLDPGITCVHDPRDVTEDSSYWKKKKAESGETDNMRVLLRQEFPEPILCIVLGWSTRQTGWRSIGGADWEGGYADPNYLTQDKTHKVVMVMQAYDQRYSKPFSCVLEDMELVD